MEGMIGEVRIFAGTFAPRTWAFCEGQLLAIAQNTALFSILGTTYGGDGRTTFGLPDLRGRFPISPGTGPGLSNVVLGQRAGGENVTMTQATMPNHSHPMNVNSGAGTTNEPTGNYPASNNVQVERGGTVYDVNSFAASPNASMGAGAVGNTGGSIPMNIRNPYLGSYYIICLQGVYPSRN